MRVPVDVTSVFTSFVKVFGGECVEDLLPDQSYKANNADYVFRDKNIIAELKCLEDDKSSDPKFQTKIETLYSKWIHSGLIPQPPAYPIAVDSSSLPEECVLELIDLYKPLIERPIKKANKQIKTTKKLLSMPNAKGLLLLVNDGNFAVQSDMVLHLAERSLKGYYSSINSMVHFTVNMVSDMNGVPKDILVWVPLHRSETNRVSLEFLHELRNAWVIYFEKMRGEKVDTMSIRDIERLEEIKFIK